MWCTKHHVQVCYVGDKIEDCVSMLFVDASFAAEYQHSKSTSGTFLALVGSNTFVPLSWFVKKQGAITHSSSESEFLALDAGLRVSGIPTLILWEMIVSVFFYEDWLKYTTGNAGDDIYDWLNCGHH